LIHSDTQDPGWGFTMCSMTMFRRLMTVAAVLALAAVATAAADDEPVDVSGLWEFSWQSRRGARIRTLELEQDGTELTGIYYGEGGAEHPLTGSIEDDRITFTVSYASDTGRTRETTYRGTVAGDTMAGTTQWRDRIVEWQARRR